MLKLSRCSREVEVDWAAISECAKGLEGNRLHKEAGDRTHALVPRVSGVSYKTFLEIISRSYIFHLVYVYAGVRRRY